MAAEPRVVDAQAPHGMVWRDLGDGRPPILMPDLPWHRVKAAVRAAEPESPEAKARARLRRYRELRDAGDDHRTAADQVALRSTPALAKAARRAYAAGEDLLALNLEELL